MKINFVITDRCNARCSHCCTSCGPLLTTQLSADSIESVMNQAAALADDSVPKFCITGGEPFLDFDLLLRVITYGASLGAPISCVSNGYWASSTIKADSLLEQLQKAGLKLLIISSSRFHQEFVPSSRVQRALSTAKKLGLSTQLKFVSTATDNGTDTEVADWARETGYAAVQILPLQPTIREQTTLPESDFERSTELPNGPCPSPVVSIREDGKAYACCTPGGFVPFLELGHIEQDSLKKIRHRFVFSGRQQILRRHGPAYFAKTIQARGLGHRLRSAYNGVCDLCTHIANDPLMAEVAESCEEALELKQLNTLFPLSGTQLHSAVPRI